MSDVPVPVGAPGDGPGPAGSFSITQRYALDAPPPVAFRVFVDRINEWWDQRLHPEARTLIEPTPGGAFKQLWSSGGAWLATVAHIDIPYRLRLVGPLAMTRPVQSVVDLTFEPDAASRTGGTVLLLRHDAVGAVDAETAATYERSWQDLVGRAFVERLRAG